MVKNKNKSKTKLSRKRSILVLVLVFASIAIGCGGIAFSEYKDWQARKEVAEVGQDRDGKDEDVMGATSCEEEIELFKAFNGQRKWFLLGDEFSDDQTLHLKLELNSEHEKIYTHEDFSVKYQLVGASGSRSSGYFQNIAGEDGSYGAAIDVSLLPADEYMAYAVADYGCGEVMSGAYKLYVSYPVYVTWTIDWEGSDIPQKNLNDMDAITAKHRDFPLTHFFNPRIYAYDGISQARRDYLTQWVIQRRDKHGHSIGLHLHMFPDMVEAAGVEPQYSPAWGWHRTDGYDIMVSGYSYEKMDRILDWSKQKFIENGLGVPTTFRAGGWFADEGTLKVLEDNGFVIDSSGRDRYSLGTNNVETHWDLSTTTQPYRPNINNQNSAASPTMEIWEFPNNGGNAYTLSAAELYSAFTDNYKGIPVDERKVVTYLSHPDWFQEDKPKMDEALTKIEKNMYEDDTGPVIYVTLDDLYDIWE
jgi:hypothetical protein